MTTDQLTYLAFGGLLILALVFDLGLLSKKTSHITMRKAFMQTAFWVTLALSFMFFVWYEYGREIAFEYLSAYLTEWSLSIDNIFVFILIFSFFGVKEKFYARVLLLGILMAIVFRVIFISIGIALVERFHWLLYIFGAILLFTGIKMFSAKHDEEIDLSKNKVYNFLKRFWPLIPEDGEGKFTIRRNGKKYYTTIFVVVVMLATTDIVFALDSIPAVFGISTHRVVIYTSNIFAVLGLRSLFFLLKGAVGKFSHLQQGIAVVLVFIGLKMLAEIFHIKVPVYVSLLVIMVCLAASVVYSIYVAAREPEPEDKGQDADLH
ncbi:MAG TPA: TerC/Alx family metal homeostasis membrane protein [Flavitalea sp.]|nr:TerC/Alx family metal homeostasis membrane protein [Flavitalea sp.]